MQIQWKDIKGFDNYSISNDGQIFNKTTKQFRKALKHKKGYLYIDLWKNNKRYNFLIHRLVVDAFEGLIDNLQVDHINCIKTDNRICNLEQVTMKENLDRAYKNGLLTKHVK